MHWNKDTEAWGSQDCSWLKMSPPYNDMALNDETAMIDEEQEIAVFSAKWGEREISEHIKKEVCLPIDR